MTVLSRPALRAVVSTTLGAVALALTACQPSPNAAPPPAANASAVNRPPSGPAGVRNLGGNQPAAAPPARHGARLPDNMALGNPDNATGDTENRDHLLQLRKQFAFSYSETNHFPNWVGWKLVASDIGNAERGQFHPDPELPDGFLKVTTGDYTGSGYDRGHNCPSKDRSSSREENDAVFVMSNITPQQHGMNAGPWELLENYCRELARQGNDLYIYCGHAWDSPKGKTIGKARIAVPDFGWKVVVVVPAGSDPVSRINADTRVIAVRMPNISTISKEDWRKFKVSVAEIEQVTGLKFFTALSPEVASKLKNKVDFDAGADPVRTRSGGGGSRSHGNRAPQTEMPQTAAPGGGDGQVWVNLKSGVYWLPGTQYYGKTKQGKYMSEDEAIKAGYHKPGGH